MGESVNQGKDNGFKRCQTASCVPMLLAGPLGDQERMSVGGEGRKRGHRRLSKATMDETGRRRVKQGLG